MVRLQRTHDHNKHETHHHQQQQQQPRIPLALQTVLIDANRGIDVHAPTDKSASKTFFRWRFWERSLPSGKSGTTSGGKKSEQQQQQQSDSCKLTSCAETAAPKSPKKKKPKSLPTLSPQEYLDAMMRSRGYSAAKYSTLSSAYYNKPTPLQLASYGVYTISLIRESNIEGLKEIMALGLSPNASNAHGESIVHNVCRRCDVHVLNVLIEAGCEIQISDDNGRTPLHDACWAPEPNFPLVEQLLERDIRLLFMADSHGHLPLSYTRQGDWSEWLQFLQSKKDIYWPKRCTDPDSSAPPLSLLSPHSRPIPNPKNALSERLATMVAGGKMTAKEVALLRQLEDDDETDESDSYDESSYDDSDSSYDSDDDDDFDDDCTEPETASTNDSNASWNDNEMKEVLESITSPIKRPLVW